MKNLENMPRWLQASTLMHLARFPHQEEARVGFLYELARRAETERKLPLLEEADWMLKEKSHKDYPSRLHALYVAISVLKKDRVAKMVKPKQTDEELVREAVLKAFYEIPSDSHAVQLMQDVVNTFYTKSDRVPKPRRQVTPKK